MDEQFIRDFINKRDESWKLNSQLVKGNEEVSEKNAMYFFDTYTGHVEIFDKNNRLFQPYFKFDPYHRFGFAPVTLHNDNIALFGGHIKMVGTGLDEMLSVTIFDVRKKGFQGLSSTFNQKRVNVAAVSLSRDEVLIVGGADEKGMALNTCEIFTMPFYEFTLIDSPMSVGRKRASAVLLENGKILISGGQDSRGDALNTTEIYDPETRTFTDGPPMLHARYGHSSTVLKDGKVLICGGDSKKTTEIYDPEIISDKGLGVFMEGKKTVEERFGHVASLLDNGDVVLYGGRRNPSPEIYNHETEEFYTLKGQ